MVPRPEDGRVTAASARRGPMSARARRHRQPFWRLRDAPRGVFAGKMISGGRPRRQGHRPARGSAGDDPGPGRGARFSLVAGGRRRTGRLDVLAHPLRRSLYPGAGHAGEGHRRHRLRHPGGLRAGLGAGAAAGAGGAVALAGGAAGGAVLCRDHARRADPGAAALCRLRAGAGAGRRRRTGRWPGWDWTRCGRAISRCCGGRSSR